MPNISLYETILVISTAAVFLVYHLHLYVKVHQAPLTTAIGVTNHARHMWVEGIIRGKRDILAVQTLRNQVRGATFLASTAILISLGSFSAAFRPGVFMEVSHTLNLLGIKTETLWMFKLPLTEQHCCKMAGGKKHAKQSVETWGNAGPIHDPAPGLEGTRDPSSSDR